MHATLRRITMPQATPCRARRALMAPLRACLVTAISATATRHRMAIRQLRHLRQFTHERRHYVRTRPFDFHAESLPRTSCADIMHTDYACAA